VVEPYYTAFLEYLEVEQPKGQPESLYAPSNYILGLGGKRIRPLLTLLAADVCNGDFRAALPAAMAVEVFHNFSLVHDDIMDAAPLRRGQQTVHNKWDINAGILSGDVMLVAAYQYFESYPPKLFKELVTTFSLTAQQVCEGQQMDVDFPQQNEVTYAQYLQMITYKTAVLLGCALKMGALIGGASTDLAEQWYAFGKNIGIAFQLQDDYLDAFGDPKTFGKQVGGDIIENKKTFLYLCALKNGNSLQTAALIDWFSKNLDDNTEKIQQVKEIFKSTGAEAATRAEIQRYTHKAFDLLTALPYPEDRLQPLKNLAEALIQRTT